MRMLILSTEFPPGPGGIGTHAYELARHLNGRGWDVKVIAPQAYASDEEVETFNSALPFPIVRLAERGLGPVKWTRRLKTAHGEVSSWRPDILLASGMRAVWLAALLSGWARIPWIAIGHGTEFGVRNPVARLINRWSYGLASSVICVSQYTWRQMVMSGISPRMGRVIHNGADGKFFRSLPEEEVRHTRDRLGLGSAKVILTVGQVTPRKGQDVVIRALPHVLEQIPEAHYLVVGLGTNQDAFSNLAAELGVANNVRFLGKVDQVELLRLLNASDVFVMTSRHTQEGDFEGYGIAVVEAALCGRPAVVSTDSGLTEAIVDGETGIAVPQEQPEAVADALTKLLADDQYRWKMGRRARERAENLQTWKSRIDRYQEALRDVMDVTGSSIRIFRAAHEPIHVLHIIDSLELGGAERVLVDVANHARAAGLRVSVCATRSGGPLASALHEDIPVHYLNRRHRFHVPDLRTFGEIVEAQRVDLVHAHGRSTFSFVAAAKSAGYVRTPVLLHDHYGRIETDAAVPLWFRKWGASKVDHYVGVSQRLTAWAKRAGVPPERVEFIENAVDPERIVQATSLNLHEAFGISGQGPVGVMIGKVSQEKGVLELIEAMAVSSADPPIQMIVVGRVTDVDYHRICCEAIGRYGLQDRVHLVGERADVPRILQGAEFVAIPSLSEASQIVLLESLTAGVPLVATRVGEAPHVLESKGVLEFVTPGSPVEFAAALDRLMKLTPEERRQRGLKGRKAMMESRSISGLIPRWLNTYDKIIEATGSAVEP